MPTPGLTITVAFLLIAYHLFHVLIRDVIGILLLSSPRPSSFYSNALLLDTIPDTTASTTPFNERNNLTKLDID